MSGLSVIKNDSTERSNDLVTNDKYWDSSTSNFWGERKMIRIDSLLFKLCLAKYLDNLNVVNRDISGNQRRECSYLEKN